VTVEEAIVAERLALADALEQVGPDGATLCPAWTAADVAAHVVSLDEAAGIPTFLGRSLVARWAIRLNAPAARFPAVTRATMRRARRRGFDAAVAQLRQPPPRLLLRPSVAPVGLFEVFVHHEDVRRPSGILRAAPAPDLTPVVPWLLRYQRPLLRGVSARVTADEGGVWTVGDGPAVELWGPLPEIVLWLAGRPGTADVALEGDAAAVALLRDRRVRV